MSFAILAIGSKDVEATSIAYSSSVSGTYLSTELFQKLGIADQVLPKSRRVEGGQRVGTVVAMGGAEIGFQQISELMPIDGIDYVGPLPAAVQRVSVVSAGIGARAYHLLLTDLASRKDLGDWLQFDPAGIVTRRVVPTSKSAGQS